MIKDLLKFTEEIIEEALDWGAKYFKEAHWILKGNCIFIVLLMIGALEGFKPLIKHLWGQHWAFRINPFLILSFVIGPFIIWRIRPQASVLERYSLIFIAIVLSFFYYFLGVEYMRSLNWFEYHLCADQLIDKTFGEKQWICNSPSMHRELSAPPKDYMPNPKFYKYNTISKLFSYPFLGGIRLAWRIYHRKTIKEMGPEFEWRWFDNITIFLSLIWMQMLFIPVIGPIFAFITFFILYIIRGIIYSICNVF
jgi:hypothetical protein